MTHKKGDSDLLRSATIETPLIDWVHVRPLQGHMYVTITYSIFDVPLIAQELFPRQ